MTTKDKTKKPKTSSVKIPSKKELKRLDNEHIAQWIPTDRWSWLWILGISLLIGVISTTLSMLLADYSPTSEQSISSLGIVMTILMVVVIMLVIASITLVMGAVGFQRRPVRQSLKWLWSKPMRHDIINMVSSSIFVTVGIGVIAYLGDYSPQKLGFPLLIIGSYMITHRSLKLIYRCQYLYVYLTPSQLITYDIDRETTNKVKRVGIRLTMTRAFADRGRMFLGFAQSFVVLWGLPIIVGMLLLRVFGLPDWVLSGVSVALLALSVYGWTQYHRYGGVMKLMRLRPGRSLAAPFELQTKKTSQKQSVSAR